MKAFRSRRIAHLQRPTTRRVHRKTDSEIGATHEIAQSSAESIIRSAADCCDLHRYFACDPVFLISYTGIILIRQEGMMLSRRSLLWFGGGLAAGLVLRPATGPQRR